MSDKVIVSKSEIEKRFNRFATPTQRLETIMQYIDQATPVSGEVVGYVDEFGNFENNLKPWMKDEPNVIWRAVYTSPQLEPDTVPREKYDKLMNALSSIQSLKRYFDNSPQSTLVIDAYEVGQIIAEAINGE